MLGDRTEAVESVEVAEDAGEGGETPAAGGMAPSVLGEPGKDMCVQSMSAFFLRLFLEISWWGKAAGVLCRVLSMCKAHQVARRQTLMMAIGWTDTRFIIVPGDIFVCR